MGPLRVGIAGCGSAGLQHAQALAGLPDVALIAAHDSDPERAAALGVPAVSFDELVRRADAVCVATPDVFHARQIVAALRAGVRIVVVETPALLSAGEAVAVHREARAHGATVIVAQVQGRAATPPEQQRMASTADAVRASLLQRAASLQATAAAPPQGSVADLAAVWREALQAADSPLRLHDAPVAAAAGRDVASADAAGAAAIDRPRVVAAGAGVMGTVHAALASQHGRVVRVAARSTTSAEPLAMLLGADPGVITDPHLFDTADVALVATPPRAHAAATLAALEAGCDVLVEKALCATVAEARRVAAAVRASSRRLVYAENWAYQPAVLDAVRRARERDLRDVTVTARWSLPPWLDLLSPDFGGAAVFDGGPHVIELARLLLGRPAGRRVRASLGDKGSDVDLRADLAVEFDGGRRARILVDFADGASEVVASAPGFELRLSPDVGLRLDGVDVPLDGDGEPWSWQALGYVDQVRALFGLGPLRAGVDDGVAVLEIIAAAYRSARLDAAVALPFAGPLDLTPWQLWRGPQPS